MAVEDFQLVRNQIDSSRQAVLNKSVITAYADLGQDDMEIFRIDSDQGDRKPNAPHIFQKIKNQIYKTQNASK